MSHPTQVGDPLVTVDPRFPHLLKDLRKDRDLSLRELAARVHYSHTYLWDIEHGRKQPTLDFASAIDAALSANGLLSSLVTEPVEAGRADRTPLTEAMRLLDASRTQVAEIARQSWFAPGDAHTRAEAAQWTRFAMWLHKTFVRDRPVLRRLGAERYSRRMREGTGASPFRMEVSRQGRTPHTECRSITHQPAPPDVASRLAIDPHTEVVCRENRYYADNEPTQNGTTYIPLGVAGNDSQVTSRSLGRGSLYSRFAELGYEVARIREQVTTRLPTADESANLKIPPGVPVLEILHTSYDSNDCPFEVTRFTIRADLTVLDYEMTVDD